MAKRKDGAAARPSSRTVTYEPPRIEHFDEVRTLIEETAGFEIMRYGDGIQTVDYQNMGIAWDTDRRLLECRGLAFVEASGEIAARPLHKCFDFGERDLNERTAGLPALAAATEKADGSLMFPARGRGGTVWCTRAGATKLAARAMAALPEDTIRAAEALMRPIADGGEPITPSFEHVGVSRIVLRYERPALRLIAARELLSGRYLTPGELRQQVLRAERDTGGTIEPVAGAIAPWRPAWWPDDIPGWREIAAAGRAAPPGTEGIVLVWPDGMRAKLKTVWFERLHGLWENPYHPRFALQGALALGRDEALDRIRHADGREAFAILHAAVAAAIDRTTDAVETATRELREAHGDDRKGFALGIKARFGDGPLLSIAMRLRGDLDAGRPVDTRAAVQDTALKLSKSDATRARLTGPGGILEGIVLPEKPTSTAA